MKRRCPRIGDVVRVPVEMNTVGTVVECEGIMLYVKLFVPIARLGKTSSVYVRRDSVEVISRARREKSISNKRLT